MRRALFAREFRTALVPNLVTVGAILGTLVVLERLYGQRAGKAEDIRYFIDVALLVGLVVSGFISGERCFPLEVKEQRMLFLSSLPISRNWAWLAIVSARLLAGLVSLALVVALRRPLLAFWEEAHLLRLVTGLAAAQVLAYILFFSAGTLFALLFRRSLFSYAAGFSVLGFLLIETLFSSIYSTWPPQFSLLVLIPVPFDDPRLPPFLVAFLSLLLLSSLLLSWRFFVRGEIGNPKRRIRNQLVFATTATAYLGFVFCVAASPRLASIGGTWGSPDAPYRSFVQGRPLANGISPDGRYLFVFETMERRPFMVRVSIVDTRTGHVTGQSVYGGVGWGYWSGKGDVLNLLALNNSPLDRWGYLVAGSVDLIRLSPEGREVSRLRLKGVEEIETLAGGRAFVVLREGDQGRVLLLDGASGQSSEVVRAPLDGGISVRGGGTAALVCFNNILQPRRAWVVDSLVHEVRAPRSTMQSAYTYVLFGETFGSSNEAQTALRRRFATPLTKGGEPMAGSFLLPVKDQLWVLTTGPDPKGVYFLDERAPHAKALWARSTAPEGRWEKLPDFASEQERYSMDSSFLGNFIDSVSGTGAFLTGDGGARRVFVYDSRLGISFGSKECGPGEKAFLNVDRVVGLKGALIVLDCMAKQSPSGAVHFFEYLPGSREVHAIKTITARPPFGPPLYLDEQGWEVWITLVDQEIWRSSPGTKDLRLWPSTGRHRVN
jgi:hypothetical protein